MDESHAFSSRSARSSSFKLRPSLIVALIAFVLGAALTFALGRGPEGWFGSESAGEPPATAQTGGDLLPLEQVEPGSPGPSPTAEARHTAQRVAQVAEQQGGIDQRVAAMEQRLARLDLQAQAAAGNVARAEGLLIVFAARRAVERGAPLGYLADQLSLRFGDALPNAVKAVSVAGEDPVTLDQLLARLEGLAPTLAQIPHDERVLERIGREIAQLFVVRTEDTPSPRAESRLERARLFLESGRTEAAMAEVQNMPNAAEASAWIADAERYARAERALELLETTAILEPRLLRDGTGNRVEQPSPVSAN